MIIADATKRHWVSGAPGGETGTNYIIKLVIKTDKKVEFQNLWLGAENIPFSMEFFTQEAQKSLQKGDSVLLTYNYTNNQSARGVTPKRLPIQYKGEALIECVIGGKARYFTVRSFRELMALNGE